VRCAMSCAAAVCSCVPLLRLCRNLFKFLAVGDGSALFQLQLGKSNAINIMVLITSWLYGTEVLTQ
jgi:hypothetical protein